MAAGSFKIYGLQKDGSRIPAAGGIIEGNNGSSGGNSGVSEIITLTQAEFDALSQTNTANYHANGVRTILVKGVSESGETDILRSYGIDAAGNAVPIVNGSTDEFVRTADVLTFEEIEASTDLSGKIPSAEAVKQLNEGRQKSYIRLNGSSGETNYFTVDLATLGLDDGMYEFIATCQHAFITYLGGAVKVVSTVNT